MLSISFACTVLLLLSTLLHFEVLSALSRLLPRLTMPSRFKLLLVIGGTFLAHFTEIFLYALDLWGLVAIGAGSMVGMSHLSLSTAVYFSTETYTSLGYGDLVPAGSLRLLAGSETLNGLLLIGWSGSYLYIAMERFWRDTTQPSPPPESK